MALADYAVDRADADRDLQEDGAAVVLTVPGVDTQNGATGEVVAGVPVQVPTFALLKNYKAFEIDGSAILRTDTKCMLSAEGVFQAGVVPKVGGLVTLVEMGITYRVMDVAPVMPGGVPVFYWLQLRTG